MSLGHNHRGILILPRFIPSLKPLLFKHLWLVSCPSSSEDNCFGQKSLSLDTNVQKLICQRESQLQNLKNKKKEIHVSNYGWYSAKSMKLYGRRATGVDSNGNFILGKWEQLHTTTSARGLGGDYYITISGDYVNFAFSYDIVGGTDFPYSGVFWTRSHDTDWDRINIHLSGSCRMADVSIYIGEEKVVGVTNCGSHSEWKP